MWKIKQLLHPLNRLLQSIRVIQLRGIKWAGHVAGMRERERGETRTVFSSENLKERDYVGYLGADGKLE
jgi:hypothetical protein